MRWGFALSGLLAVAAASSASAQVIQLPSFHSFSINTTVIVPDSGPRPSASLRRGRTGRSQYGPLRGQHALGIEREAAGVAALAQIHDPRQAEARLAEQLNARRAKQPDRAALESPPQRATAGGGLKSVAQIERQRDVQRAALQQQARTLVDKARSAEARGKPKLAALYYAQAAGQATGALKSDVDSAIRRLEGSSPGKNVPRRGRGKQVAAAAP